MDSLTVHPLCHAASVAPNTIALISENDDVSYGELYRQAASICDHFRRRGLETGAIIVLDDLNQKELITFLWACTLGGFIAFPVNTRFPQKALALLIKDLKPALVISQRRWLSKVTISPDEFVVGSNTPEHKQILAFDPLQGATLLMTSGSSGSAKLVQHSLMNHMASASGSNQNIKLDNNDRWLLNLPLYHVGGLAILFRSILATTSLVIPSPDQSLLQNILKNNVTHISLVATQLQRIIEKPEAAEILGQLKAILLGGSAIPQALIQKALKINLPIHISYGSTEMASQITTSSSQSRSTSLTHSGKVLSGHDLIISHEGEILVKGASLAQGYRNGDTLSELRDSDGWFHTGDVGYLDVSGDLTVTGRLDHQFISGGENIQPEHIERALQQLPGVIQAVVLPQTDLEFGFRPVAFLELELHALSMDEIRLKLRKTLPGFMIPIAFFPFPKEFNLHNLKISRQDLAKALLNPNKGLQPLL